MSVFGIIVSGRLVQTDFVQVGPNQFLISLENVESVNHVVVFMTGISPLAEGMAASVHLSWPNLGSAPIWQYLGFISNQKPSAIFKISKLKTPSSEMSSNFTNSLTFQTNVSSSVAQIGISVEPMASIIQMTPDPTASVSTQDDFMQFCAKTAENLFNFCASFSASLQQIQSSLVSPNQQFVPLSKIQQWYESYSRRLEQNPNFWKS